MRAACFGELPIPVCTCLWGIVNQVMHKPLQFTALPVLVLFSHELCVAMEQYEIVISASSVRAHITKPINLGVMHSAGLQGRAHQCRRRWSVHDNN